MKLSITLIGALIIGLITPPATAGFGDFLNKLGKEASSVLDPSTESDDKPAQDTGLDSSTLSAGLKEALRVGSERAVAQVSATDGFLANPKIHIPLPATVEQAVPLLRRFGLGNLVDDLELSINRAAEQAAPAATAHLSSALEAMTIDDARQIYEGPPDAATRYFEDQTAARIGADFQPLVREAMNQVGVSRYYQQLVSEATRYPLIGDLNLDLEQHVTDAAVSGLFTILAEQEALIRKDPVARTTDLLKQVFGP